jgi:tetratricopeptide (TPR) repeat protein
MDGTAGAALRVEHLSDLGRLADAEREARAALAAEPQSPALLAALSRVFLQGRNYTEGLAAADAAAAQAPDDERLHRLRALHLSGLGFHRDAAAAAHAAVVLAPQEPLTAITQARVLQAARLHVDALAVARRAVALDPALAQAHLVLADIADDAGDRRLARAAYQEVLRLDPQHAVARHDLALLDARARRPVAALAGLVEAGMLDPALPVVLRSVAAVLWQLSWRLRMLLFVATIATLGAAASPVASRVAAGVVLLVAATVVGLTARALPRQARPVVRAALRTDRPLRFTYFAVTACLAIFLEVAVTGQGVFAAGVWLVLVALGLLAAVVRLVRGLRRRRT